MNFIKGIVDGILATDSEAISNKTKNQNEVDDQDNESERINKNRPLQNRNFTNDNVFITNTISQLSELYRNERENCLNGLIVRYGEGRVQQLSQVLKSNHETMLKLSQEFQNNLTSMGELNNKVESVAVDQLKLKNENNTLLQQLNSLSSENENLKSQLTQANITIKSNENHILSLKELLKDNRNTFETMKNRCAEFYRYKSEIKDLKKKLEFTENEVKMLSSERDKYWGDPNRVLKDEDYKKRIAEALERQDRAIRVAKAMATQRVQLPTSEKPESEETKESESAEKSSENKEVEQHKVTELKVQVERLEDENTHLKEINDNLHTMYADLNNQLKEVKNTYLKESLESLAAIFPARTNPIQLVFVQPTAVLDLDFDEETLHKYSHKPMTHRSDSAVQHSKPETKVPRRATQTIHTTLEKEETTSQSFQQSSRSISPTLEPSSSYSPEGPVFVNPLHEKLHSSFKLSPKDKEKEKDQDKSKKRSHAFNLRSKVIQYVTGLDGSPKSSRTEEKESNLLNLDSPHLSHQTDTHQDHQHHQHHHNVTQIEEPVSKSTDKTGKSGSWNSEWDFFEDEAPSARNEFTSPVETVSTSKSNEFTFDFILDEERERSQNNLSTSVKDNAGTTQPEHSHSHGNVHVHSHEHFHGHDHDQAHVEGHDYGKDQETEELTQTLEEPSSEVQQDQDKTSGDPFSDDIFDSIINEQESEREKPQPSGPSKKGWDVDFDDEMFQA